MKDPEQQKKILRNKNKAGNITHLDFKPYFKATVFKTVRYWNKNDTQINGTEQRSEKIHQHKSVQLIFNKGAKSTQWTKDSFAKNCARTI